MTDLAVKVVLKADGSGLVGQARVSKEAIGQLSTAATAAGAAGRAMGAGAAAAQQGVQGMAQSGGQAATVARTLAADGQQAAVAIGTIATISGTARASLSSFGNSGREVAAATAQLVTQLQQQGAALDALRADALGTGAANDNLRRELAEVRGEVDRLNAALRQGGRAHREQRDAANDNVRSAGQVRAGYFSLGQQMQDVGIQVSMGTDLMRVMAMQGGQLATAIDMIGVRGAGGRLAAFFAGPYGAAVITVTALLGPYIGELLSADDAQGKLEIGASALSEAQSALGDMFDRTTGKLKKQTEAMLLNAQATAIKLRADGLAAGQSSRETLASAGDASTLSRVAGAGAILSGNVVAGAAGLQGNQQVRNLARLAREAQAIENEGQRARRQRELMQIAEGTDFSGSGVDRSSFINALLKAATARERASVADDIERSLDRGVLANSLREPGTGRTRKPPSTAARDEFGRDAADKIAGLTDRFSATPDLIREINGQVRQLDDLIEDLGRRKPPGFEALIASAQEAKGVVRDGLIGAVADAFARPRTLADQADAAIGELDAAIVELQAKQPIDWEKSVAAANAAKGRIAEALNEPLNEYLEREGEALQLQQLLTAGKVAEAEVLREVLRIERIRGPLSEAQVDSIRDAVRARREEARAAEDVYRVQQLQLDTVRDIGTALDAATQAFVRGDLGQLLKTPGRLIESVQTFQGRKLFEGLFGGALADLEREITEGPVEKASRRMAGGMDAATKAVEKLGKAAAGAAQSVAGEEPDLVVIGEREPPVDPRDVIERAMASVATEIADLFGSREMAAAIGADIGAAAAGALKGAGTGRAVSGVAGSLGIGLDNTGAAIGGAIGSFLPIPGGQIIGSIVGGLAGKLFAGSPDSGYAAIGTDASGRGYARAETGGKNKAAIAGEMAGVGSGVVDQLSQIAASLGGVLGGGLSFGTIGKRGDEYVYDSDGPGRIQGTRYDTLEAAVSAMLTGAIGRGAVTGLSDAVRRALGSSGDIDQALQEALGVRQLEQWLTGASGSIDAELRAFDQVAAERVRLAKSYGMDLLAVEKRNAEERSKLLDDTLKARVGSLQQLLDDMRYGDLFEGDAGTRRAQILGEIDDAKADATAGVAGATDRLAELYRLLTETSRDAYGTAGTEYAADRSAVETGAAAIIKMEADRLGIATAAAKAQTDAIAAGNKLVDETNNLLAVANARLAAIAAGVEAGDARTYPKPDVALVTR